MNNQFSTRNNSSWIDRFQLRSGFFKSKWQKISVTLMMGFGVVITSVAFTHSNRPIVLTLPEESPAVTVQTSAIHQVKQFNMKRTFIGRVEASQSSDLGFELDGKISSILVDEGDRVTKGQVLAYLDLDRLQARKKELLSALKQTQANLRLADITYRRYQQVVISSGVSRQQLDEAKEHLWATQAARELARSRIKSIDIEINKSTLHAPFDANITRRSLDEGQVISAGTPVLRLQQDTVPEIRVGIAGLIVNSIQVGQRIPVVIGPLSLQASVKTIIPFRDGRSRTVDVILSLDNPPTHIRSGDLVKLEFSRQIDQQGYWVPVSALSEDVRGIWSIYTVENTSRDDASGLPSAYHVIRRTIEIIHTESARVFVQGGFETGDQVITDGLQKIVPGQFVVVGTSLARSNSHFNTGLE